jgi:SAM-dependent methyltransferase
MRWDVLSELLEASPRRRFLEVGVQHGHVAKHVGETALERWGVDPDPKPGAAAHYHRLDRTASDAFFANLEPSKHFDVVFIDGMHEHRQVLRDVENALRHLDDDGFIVLHDCNPQSELHQRVPRASRVWNGDVWKALVDLRRRPDLDVFTVDADHGLGVVRRRAAIDPLHGVPETLTYADLAANRERLLGLVPASRWAERLGGEWALGRVVVVSAIFGMRDIPVAAPQAHDVDDYVLFTDSTRDVAGWRSIRHTPSPDPRMSARHTKMLALEHVEGDVVVWIDGRIYPTGRPLRPLLRRVLRHADLATFPHPWRCCAYDEARECARLGRAPRAALEAQVEAYRAAGFPPAAGLWNTMVLARRRTDEMIAFGRSWWAELERHTPRDQVSLPFLLWKHGIQCEPLGTDIYRAGASPHFERGLHRGQRV